jgi:DNA-binding response OmpR family regulator
LVIDDEPAIRALLQTVLERAGYDVETAPDGRKGIRCHRNAPADLIITDIVMPEKEGIELIRELREAHPEVKIFAISGGGRVAAGTYLTLAGQLGATRVFAKPVKTDVLLSAVREVVGTGTVP